MRQWFFEHIALTSDEPQIIEVASAKGCHITRTNGSKVLDFISGINVSSVGHCHPSVVEAVQKQAATHMHTLVYGEHIQSEQVLLAKKLASLLPSPLSVTYFVNSGSEAVEGAMKVAKKYTKRKKILSAYLSYHGSTQGAMSLNSDSYFKDGYEPLLPDIGHFKFNSFEDLNLITDEIAAVIVEPIQAEIGIQTPKNGYLEALREKCTQTGTLLIFDEIQTGFGRTGHWFACQKYGVTPDIILLAKGMGGGMPIGAFISSPKIMDVIRRNPVLGHISTFGGHPVNCAASRATIEVLENENWIADIKRREQLFHKYLKHHKIKEIRSAGLMMAVDLGNENLLMNVVKNALDKGLMIDWFLFNTKSIRIAPPLSISDNLIKEGCEIILDCLDI